MTPTELLTTPALYTRTANGITHEIVETGRPTIKFQVYSQPNGASRKPFSANWGHKTIEAARTAMNQAMAFYAEQDPVVEETTEIKRGAAVQIGGQTWTVTGISRDGVFATLRRRGYGQCRARIAHLDIVGGQNHVTNG